MLADPAECAAAASMLDNSSGTQPSDLPAPRLTPNEFGNPNPHRSFRGLNIHVAGFLLDKDTLSLDITAGGSAKKISRSGISSLLLGRPSWILGFHHPFKFAPAFLFFRCGWLGSIRTQLGRGGCQHRLKKNVPEMFQLRVAKDSTR
jgi:hypothetical protein